MNNTDIGNTDTLILCGGKGTRLQKIVSDKPKILADIKSAPFIKYLLEYLQKMGVKRTILCTGNKHDQIKKWIKTEYSGNIEVIFSYEKKRLDTGGAIKNAYELINSNNFIVLNGDSYCKINYKDLLLKHSKSEALLTIVVTSSTVNNEYGSVAIDKNNNVIKFKEKATNNNKSYINAGIYCFSKKIFNYMPTNNTFSLEKDLLEIIKDNKYYAYVTKKRFVDIGTPKNYYLAKNIIK